MARKVESYLVDDFDGSKPAETVLFAFKGDAYEIDLAEHNAREFEKDLARYIEAARRVAGRNGRNGRRSEQRHRFLQAARVWLRQQGHDISDRGRIAKPLLQKFEQEQGHGG